MSESDLAAKAGDVKIGSIPIHRVGLGTNRLTDIPEAHALLHHAIELGVNFIDTARLYGSGASETTIGNALAPFQNYEGLLIASKGGYGSGRPESLRAELETSLRALRTDHIDLYQLHRVDSDVPIEESIGVLKEFQDEGKIRYIGLSEVDEHQIKRAEKIARIVSVQNEYNVIERRHEAVLDFCTDHGIVFIPWFPLGGLRGGAHEVSVSLAHIAKKYDALPQQIALAWLLKRSPIIAPIPGTLSLEHLEENLRSGSILLSDEDFELIQNG